MKMSPQEALEKYWGFSTFRPQQLEIVNAVTAHQDAVALLPTGGGKSLCYQLPAVMQEGIVLVVSPLLSLMRDQVMQLNKKGIKAMYIPGGTSYGDMDTLLDNCIYGNYKLLYLSPERLQQELVIARIKQMNISLLAIDEAHCISQWGHDFRPAYRNIAAFRELIPEVNCLAVTATATPQVAQDILEQLALKKPQIFQTSFNRKNLAYIVIREEDKFYRLAQLLKKNPGSAIVYVRSRKAAVSYANHLRSKGFSVHFYHGGLGNQERNTKFHDWMENRVQIMVATTAFGMGIDKPDVQTVVHVELPESLESYFQEAGRAGRNGKNASSVILNGPGDIEKLKNQFVKILAGVDAVRLVYKKINSYFQISYGEGEQETFRFNFMDFCKTYDLNTLTTYSALQILDRNSVIGLAQDFYRKASLQITVSPVALTYYLITNPGIEAIIKSVLRTYGGIFDQPLNIDHTTISKKANQPVTKVHEALLQLQKDEMATYAHENYDTAITLLVPREDDHVIHSISRDITTQNKQKTEQVKSILHYINNDKICRNVQLLAYFGEKSAEPCGHCDVCLSKVNKAPENQEKLRGLIVETLKHKTRNSRDICSLLPHFQENLILNQLQQLLETNKITLTENNTYTLKK